MAYLFDTMRNREFNPKCIVISGGVVGAYLFLPSRSLSLSALLAVGTHVDLAHYDTMFGCKERLKSFDGWFPRTFDAFKPPVGDDGTYGG
jgi:hypothetical protein